MLKMLKSVVTDLIKTPDGPTRIHHSTNSEANPEVSKSRMFKTCLNVFSCFNSLKLCLNYNES